MKQILTQAGLSLLLALCLAATTATAQAPQGQKGQVSPEHAAAMKKCHDDFAAAKKEAQAKKGKARKAALAAANKAHKQCMAQHKM
jgi:hypothetical protein